MTHRHRRSPLLQIAHRGSLTLALFAISAPASPASAQPAATCLAEARAAPSQPAVLLGEPVELTITLDRLCPESNDPLDVVFVLDGADAPPGTLGPELYRRARETLKIFSPEEHVGLRVSFASRFQLNPVLCPLSDSTHLLRPCIRRLADGQGSTDLGASIRDATHLLEEDRPQGGSSADEAIVIIASARDELPCDDARSASSDAQQQGIGVATIAVNTEAGTDCRLALGISPRWRFSIYSSSHLSPALRVLRRELRAGRIATSELRWPLPPGMAWVPGAASPPPDDLGPDGRTPIWRDVLTAEPAEIVLALRTDRAGRHDTGIAPALRWTEMDGREGALVLRPPPVWVLAPRELPR